MLSPSAFSFGTRLMCIYKCMSKPQILFVSSPFFITSSLFAPTASCRTVLGNMTTSSSTVHNVQGVHRQDRLQQPCRILSHQGTHLLHGVDRPQRRLGSSHRIRHPKSTARRPHANGQTACQVQGGRSRNQKVIKAGGVIGLRTPPNTYSITEKTSDMS
jgi:hypothetical protein